MSRLTSIFSNLPPLYSRDPVGTAALSIRKDSGAKFIVDGFRLKSIPVSGTSLNLALKSVTITALVAQINAVTGYTASVTGSYGPLLAHGLIEATYDGSSGASLSVLYFTQNNYRILAPFAAMYDDLDADWNEGLKQTDLRRATGIWLDRIGLVYGVPRTANEPDTLYARRITAASIAPKCNGYAIAAIIQNALGATAVVTDTGPAKFAATITLNLSTGNPYDTATLNSLLNSYKAFGTSPSLVLQGLVSESNPSTGDSDGFSSSATTGSGEWGRQEFATRESGN